MLGNTATRKTSTHPYRTAVLTAFAVGLLFAALPARSWQQDQKAGGMSGMNMSARNDSGQPCDTLNGMANMSVMGESMAAMADHMCITPLRPKQPGDEQKAKAVVAAAKATMDRYKDYKKALADGYVIANPTVDQPQFHFNNEANTHEADLHFDPSKPTSLLYRRTQYQRYKLEGVMYTASPSTTEDELNQRIPLSIARWHEHTNFCAAPADKVKDYHGDKPKFGMFGSIHTREACTAEGGTFYPVIFTWMIHVFPYEPNFKDVFSMNDDVPHVQ